MTDYFHEYVVRELFREGQQMDRQLEQWGWFRGAATPGLPGRFRVGVGSVLVQLGLRLQRREPREEPRD
jgi:hypothetical protein